MSSTVIGVEVGVTICPCVVESLTTVTVRLETQYQCPAMRVVHSGGCGGLDKGSSE